MGIDCPEDGHSTREYDRTLSQLDQSIQQNLDERVSLEYTPIKLRHRPSSRILEGEETNARRLEAAIADESYRQARKTSAAKREHLHICLRPLIGPYTQPSILRSLNW